MCRLVHHDRFAGIAHPPHAFAGIARPPTFVRGSNYYDPGPEASVQSTTFERALEHHRVEWSRTTAADFADALRAVLEQPAVGAPLPFETVSLADLPVTIDPTPRELDAAATGVTAADFAVADYGSLVLTAADEGTEPVSCFPDRHVAVLRERDIVETMAAAFERLDGRFADGLTSAVFATGPSATADMGSLVYGAHGPTEVHVLLLTDQ